LRMSSNVKRSGTASRPHHPQDLVARLGWAWLPRTKWEAKDEAGRFLWLCKDVRHLIKPRRLTNKALEPFRMPAHVNGS
jgi:hypothetical protein